MRILLLVSLLLAAQITANSSQKLIQRLHAPTIVDPRSDSVVMRCEYDLQGKDLYSVSWYKGDKMLYSWRLQTKGISFPNESDVNVSINQSNNTHLVLRGHRNNIHKNLITYRGTYYCEVMTEQPFMSDLAEANVSSAIVPKENPVIEGVATNYQVGEQLEAVCTSTPSLPAAELTFYLNNDKIDSSQQENITINEILTSTKLKISLSLEPSDSIAGRLNLSCEARLPGIERTYKSETYANLTVLGQESYANISVASKKNDTVLLGIFVLTLYPLTQAQ